MDDEVKTDPRETLAQLLAAAASPLDRLPSFKSVAEDFALQLGNELRMRDGIDSDVAMRKITSGSITELQEAGSDYVAAPIDVDTWDARIVFAVNRELLCNVVEALFGGDGSMPQAPIDRAVTKLDKLVLRHFIEEAGRAMERSFSRTGGLTISVRDVEDDLQEVDYGRKISTIVVVRFEVEIYRRVGELLLILPRHALDGMRRWGLPGESVTGSHDPEWDTQFARELKRADVRVSAMIRDRSLTLGDIANMKVGDILPLEADPDTNVYLEANNETIFICAMGQTDGRYTVRINDSFDRTRDLMDEIAGV